LSAQPPLAILGTGIITAVGMTAAESCAAFRAKLANPSETRFAGSGGEWITAHQVPLETPWRGVTRLAKLAALAVDEALADVPREEWRTLPMLLCVAEADRPGRLDGLDQELAECIQAELGTNFGAPSVLVSHGRVSVAVALAQARTLMKQSAHRRALVVAVDSLLSWPTLSHYDEEDRLLSPTNSNGFLPGEAAGALLVGPPDRNRPQELLCTGIGFAKEAAHIGSEEPLRADGLSQAIQASLADAGLSMGDMDFRIADCAGEHYYFKEAALALSRTLRQRKEEFDIWHPAECTGEVGAAAGTTVIAAAHAACLKGYANGPNILAHWSNDSGQRAALTLQHRGA
jgi:3-oxoacyl-[acyl-carrier-protein] synthase-1